jgi:acyl transferase domain-containing protein
VGDLSERLMQVSIVAMLALGSVTCGSAAENKTAGGETDKNVAAEVAGQKITMQELDDYLRKNNAKAFQDFYDARRQALDNLIGERLLAAEAASRGVTVEKLQQDVTAAAPAVSDADVSTFYSQNQARMGGQTLDQIKDKIKSFLAGQKQQQAMTDFIRDQREKKGVQIALEPPRAQVKVAENDPVRGSKSAPVQIVEFSDFQ